MSVLFQAHLILQPVYIVSTLTMSKIVYFFSLWPGTLCRFPLLNSILISNLLILCRDLNRRGTPRTAFEFARLLLTLEPHTDPHGAFLHLDYLAIKAGQVQWLLGMWDAYVNMDLGKEGEAQFDVTILPGWCWSRALALFEKEEEGHAVCLPFSFCILTQANA
jgi:Transcriptional repressor TCF25